MSAVRAVVFDYGGVLTTPIGESIRAWLAAEEIEPTGFTATLKAWLSRNAPDGTPIHRLERGELTVAAFDRLLAAELRTRAGDPVRHRDLLERLFAEVRPDPAMWALLADLRARGIRLALLSNSWGDTYPRERLAQAFDVTVISGDVGLRKPEPAIYELVLDRLGVPAASAVFVDDAEPNVAGAVRGGMAGLLHRDAASTRVALTDLLPG